MPFPLNLEEMEQSGYTFLRSESCPECLENVEVFSTPGKREIVMNPMCEALRPAVRHLEVCKPIPASKELLLKAGYTLIERIVCPHCQRAVEMYDTPSGASIILNPMMGADWPVSPHRCNIAPKQEEPRGNVQDAAGRVCDSGTPSNDRVDDGRSGHVPRDGEALLRDGGRDDASAVKLHAVRDPNYQLLAVGWQDGTLVCQWKKGKGFHSDVPEDLYLKLLRVPFAYRQYQQTIKGKFPYAKLEG